MLLLDSFLREVSRLHPPYGLTVQRKVEQDFTLPSGGITPAGSLVAMPVRAQSRLKTRRSVHKLRHLTFRVFCFKLVEMQTLTQYRISRMCVSLTHSGGLQEKLGTEIVLDPGVLF
jgi:hypothetical protein